MRKSWIAIYQNKELNETVYFDFNKNELFLITDQVNRPMNFAVSLLAFPFVMLIKNISFNHSIDPLHILLFASILGITLGLISIKLINSYIEKM